MKPAAYYFLAGLLCVDLSAMYPADQTKDDRAEVALQAAIKLEMVDGNLKAAIEQYRRIAQGGNRTAAARALVRLGQCQEKLGEAEARKAYERVVREYADQTEAAAEARARLAALGPAGTEPRAAKAGDGSAALVFRKIDFAGQGRTHLARLSPDGTKVLYVEKKDKDARNSLYVEGLPLGPASRLVEGVDATTLLFFVWSPDGRKVAYRQGRAEIRVVSSDGGEPATLWSSTDRQIAVYPMDWSRDGHNILIAIENEADRTMRMAILPSSGGEPRTFLTQPSNEWAPYPRFSADGKFIVGSSSMKGNSEVYLWSVDGGPAIRLTEHPAKDESPLWSPDGRWIIFVSDRDKTKDLWALPMHGLNTAGAPVRIKRDLGKGTWVTDCTRSGILTMFMTGEGVTKDLFVLPFDPLTGESPGQFSPFAIYPTDHFMPRWSPDGKRVAYTSRKGEISLPRIYVSSGRDKEDKEIPAPNYYVANVDWSGDGQHLVFPGFDPQERVGIFRVSLKDLVIEPFYLGERYGPQFKGAITNLRRLPLATTFMFDKIVEAGRREICTMDMDGKNIKLATDKVTTNYWTWPAPDGRHLAYVEGQALKLWSLETNAPVITLAQFPEGKPVEGPAWSPDGRQVAWKDRKQLKVLSMSDNSSRVLAEATENHELGDVAWHGGLAWSPDGRFIAYVMQDMSPGSAPHSELWVMPASGGVPRKVADAPASHPRLGEITWHPGGTMILASGGPEKTQPRTYEHWAMENFLPKLKAVK